MIISFGNFKFKSKTPICNINITHNANITSSERINNINAHFANKLSCKTITINAITLPITKGSGGLKELYEILNSQNSKPLTTGYGDYLGGYVLTEISEERTLFLPNGEFLGHSFTLKLEESEKTDD